MKNAEDPILDELRYVRAWLWLREIAVVEEQATEMSVVFRQAGVGEVRTSRLQYNLLRFMAPKMWLGNAESRFAAAGFILHERRSPAEWAP